MHTPEFDTSNRQTPAIALALVLLAALALGGWQVLLQVRMAPGTVLPAGALAVPNQAPRNPEIRPADAAVPTPGPVWNGLTAAQRLALHPLAERWPFLSELQKRRWLVLAQSFPSLPEPEQSKLHDRMTEWANLSAQQRNQVRLNFTTANKLAPDNKRAQWEAYQALTDEEKHALAASAGTHPTGAATALQPVPARKLAQVPAATANNANPLNPPKIPPISTGSQYRVIIPAPTAEMRPPTAEPTIVETAPVSVPIAEPLPLPPLPTESAAHPSQEALPSR